MDFLGPWLLWPLNVDNALQAAPPKSGGLVCGKANWTSPWQVMIRCYSWSNETIFEKRTWLTLAMDKSSPKKKPTAIPFFNGLHVFIYELHVISCAVKFGPQGTFWSEQETCYHLPNDLTILLLSATVHQEHDCSVCGIGCNRFLESQTNQIL